MRYLLSVLVFLASANSLCGQGQSNTDIIGPRMDNYSEDVRTGRVWTPEPEPLRTALLAAPHEREVRAEASTTTITLPTPVAGQEASFRIVGYDIAEDAGTGQFAHLRTWYGINENNPAQTIYLDWTERGFHAAVRGGGETYFIDPVAAANQEQYLVYTRGQVRGQEEAFVCSALENPASIPGDDLASSLMAGDCVLRQYRVAVSAAVPYSNYHGATSSDQAGLVQSAIVTTLNRVNQIFSQEVSLRLQLVANNDTLYFYGEADDPFTSNSVSMLISENAALQRNRLGNANFDLGHVFTQGSNNGRGFLRSACDPDLKGGGVTSLVTPEGDPFSVDYVAHEFGHQLGANHTQNNACNYSPLAGMEPGSGSTIMGYAGICFPDIQGNSDAYFHGRSIEEISEFTENIFFGGRCATIVANTLANPLLTPVSDQVIPPGTPFKLSGQASGDGLVTYNWEQFDAEQSIMPPADTSRQGPLFRSFPPVATGERYFPRLPAVVNNLNTTWEVLPEVNRELNFRLTVRNANATYGCTAEEDVSITVTEVDGAFAVTDPAQGNQWSMGQTAQIQWNLAGTDRTTYNTPQVDILFSADGGANFDPLALAVPNTGIAELIVPNEITDRARILVRSVGNVFYNISTGNFSVVDAAGVPSIELAAVSPLSVADCFTINGEANFEFLTRGQGGASDSLDFTISGLPPGVSAELIPAYPRPGGRFRLNISGLDELGQGAYVAQITYDGAYGNVTETVSFTKFGEEPQAGPDGMLPSGFSPDIRPTLSAENNGADQYQIQVATVADFSELLYERNTSQPSFTLPTYLEANSLYYWRIRSLQEAGGCGITIWNETSFLTGECPVNFSTESPVTISTGAPVQIAEMPLEIAAEGVLEDLDLVRLDIEHTYLNDLQIELESPEGTILPIFDRSCGGNDDININFDDEAVRPTFPCPPVAPDIFVRTSAAPLSIFDGEEVTGTWTLRVSDLANQDGGRINGFGLKTCLEGAVLPVTFLDFVATGRKTDILLNWTVAAEDNNLGFYVERARVVSPTEWLELGFVPAGQVYAYADAAPAPETDYFYRLRQTDLDGRVSYSPIRSARLGGPAATSLQLFPNPVTGQLSYRWALPDRELENRPFTLVDAHGRVVRQGVLRSSGGSLRLAELPKGFYVLRAAGIAAQRVVKL